MVMTIHNPPQGGQHLGYGYTIVGVLRGVSKVEQRRCRLQVNCIIKYKVLCFWYSLHDISVHQWLRTLSRLVFIIHIAVISLTCFKELDYMYVYKKSHRISFSITPFDKPHISHLISN